MRLLPIESQDIVSRLTHPSPSRRPEGTVISIHFCIPVQPHPTIFDLIEYSKNLKEYQKTMIESLKTLIETLKTFKEYQKTLIESQNT